jgi:hypothetical protein
MHNVGRSSWAPVSSSWINIEVRLERWGAIQKTVRPAGSMDGSFAYGIGIGSMSD